MAPVGSRGPDGRDDAALAARRYREQPVNATTCTYTARPRRLTARGSGHKYMSFLPLGCPPVKQPRHGARTLPQPRRCTGWQADRQLQGGENANLSVVGPSSRFLRSPEESCGSDASRTMGRENRRQEVGRTGVRTPGELTSGGLENRCQAVGRSGVRGAEELAPDG